MRFGIVRVILLCFVGVVPIQAVFAQDEVQASFPGTFVYLENGLLYRYEDGAVGDACRVPLLLTDSPYVEPSNPLEAAQVARRTDVAYAPQTGFVALATNYVRDEGLDFDPSPDDPYAAKNLYLCNLTTSELRQISPEPSVGFLHEAPVFSPDGMQVAWIASDAVGAGRVLRYDIASGALEVVLEGLSRYSPAEAGHLSALVWDDGGLAVRGKSATCTPEQDRLVVIDASLSIVADDCVGIGAADGEIVQPVLYWAVANGRAVVVYSLFGPDARVQYMAGDAAEHFTASGAITVMPAGADDGVNLQVRVESFDHQSYLAVVSAGPATPDGYSGGYAFSADGQVLALLVSEGIGFARGGTDLYLLNSGDTLPLLGYYVDAQLVGSEHPWGRGGVQAVYWGRTQAAVALFGDEMRVQNNP